MTTDNTELGYSTDALAQRQAEPLQLIRQTAPEAEGCTATAYKRIHVVKES